MTARDAFRAVWNRAALKRGLSKETQESYWHFTKRLFVVCGRRSSETWTGADWERLEWWMAEQKPAFSYSSRKVARSAMDFIFREVLKMDVGRLDLPFLPKPQPALVVVPTREELGRIFTNLRGQVRLACRIMHGSGARVKECCRIRVQDIDLDPARPRVRLWDAKGAKNRVSVLPRNLLPVLRAQIEWRRLLHEQDLADGNGFVELPERCARKFGGQARKLGWQWLLASSEVKEQHRWYLSPDTVGAKLRQAKEDAGIVKKIVCHSLRKAFATECAQVGMDIRTIQHLLGHANMQTTADHYLQVNLTGAFSSADVPTARMRPVYSLPELEALALE
jgi:integrase